VVAEKRGHQVDGLFIHVDIQDLAEGLEDVVIALEEACLFIVQLKILAFHDRDERIEELNVVLTAPLARVVCSLAGEAG